MLKNELLRSHGRDLSNPHTKQLDRQSPFSEFTSLFPGQFFVMIIVYGDESGTHDAFGREPGSEYPLIAGFAAKKSVWDKFNIEWKAVLKKFENVPYFHGRELRAAREAILHNKSADDTLRKNPYYARKWDILKIESFRLALSKVAAKGNKIPLAGGINLAAFHTLKAQLELIEKGNVDLWDDPYKYCMASFFQCYTKETALQWGNFKSDVTFIFDQNKKKEWFSSIRFSICFKKVTQG